MYLYMYILIMCTLIYNNKILKLISLECCNVFMSPVVCCEVADTGELFSICKGDWPKAESIFSFPRVVFWGLYIPVVKLERWVPSEPDMELA